MNKNAALKWIVYGLIPLCLLGSVAARLVVDQRVPAANPVVVAPQPIPQTPVANPGQHFPLRYDDGRQAPKEASLGRLQGTSYQPPAADDLTQILRPGQAYNSAHWISDTREKLGTPANNPPQQIRYSQPRRGIPVLRWFRRCG